MKEKITGDRELEEMSLDACRVLIGVYAGALTNFIKENGNASLGDVTTNVMALANLISEVNRFRRY